MQASLWFEFELSIGVPLCRGNKLFLAPVDETWALRPSLEHLDAARPLSRATEPPKEEEKPALTALSVRPWHALPDNRTRVALSYTIVCAQSVAFR